MTVFSIADQGAKGNGRADDTAAIQATVNLAQPGDVVRVPTGGKFLVNGLVGLDNFMSGGIFLKSDVTLSIEAGASLQAIPNASDHYTVVTVRDCERTKIIGPGSIIGDRDQHAANKDATSQWGFGISIRDSRSVAVQNLTVARLWGDAVTMTGVSGVLIDRSTIDGNRRQGISVQGEKIKITNCVFKNATMSDLDLEIDLASQTLRDVLVQYCNFTSTKGGPAHIGVGSPVGTYRGIVIKDCQFNLRMQPIFVHDNAGNLGTPPWAFLLNRVFYEGMKLPIYRFVGYPQSWSSAS
jgi:polygalacturonase